MKESDVEKIIWKRPVLHDWHVCSICKSEISARRARELPHPPSVADCGNKSVLQHAVSNSWTFPSASLHITVENIVREFGRGPNYLMSFTRLKLVSLISLDIGFPGLLR
jgi:hypothetical protein